MPKTIAKAVDAISSGRCLIYPTETLYALGAGAFHAEAAERIVAIKARPDTKPLPIIIGHRDQLPMVTGWLSKAFEQLSIHFWPGPLSVLVPAGRRLPPQVKDERGLTSVRVTAHPLAAKICMEAGTPLIATSANRSGQEPTSRPGELDPALKTAVDMVVTAKPYPAGGSPSTVVRCVGTDRVEVVRDGVVSRARLRQAGFTIV